MATGTVPSSTLPPPPPIPVESVEHERIIRRQLSRATLYVRLVDLASSLTVWAIGVLLFFIVAALADHVVGLGIGGRSVALALLLGGTAYYLALHVAPLLIHAINPAYAAHTIEEATPSLKNSLINFLLLRQDRASIKEIVYQAVERKAASDIAALPVETTVDRSRLIHAGYVLLAVTTLFAAYKMLSPKDPFQTVARVLAPWAEIARPSRVQITDVQPGNADVYHGQVVKVSAIVHGIGEGQPVRVLYSTADGQTVDRPVAMTAAVGGRYECSLPPEAGKGESPLADFSRGIQQNVSYRIVAGDAETTPYRLTAIAAPTIIVDRLDYHFPAYTKLPPLAVNQQGDIKALEGTKVTIHAVANQPVKVARVEFDPHAKVGSPETMPLTAGGSSASGTATLQLKSDRRSPWHASYQVRFYNERGQPSQQPIQHKIEVLRDLPPEVQILRPDRLRIEVPEDGELAMEIRAVDPDFALSSVRIEGAVAGKQALKVDLIGQNAEAPSQATLPYVLRPGEHKLAAGDELKYVAVAEDNRTHPLTGSPEPNVTRTAEYTLVVTPPQNRNAAQGQAGQNQAGNTGKARPQDKQAKGANEGPRGQNQQPPRPPDQANQQPMNQGAKGQPEQPRAPQQEKGKQNQPKNQDQNEQQGQGQKGQGQDNQQQPGQKGQQGEEGGQQQGGQQQGGQPSGSQQGSQQGEQQGTSGQATNSGAQQSQSDNPMGGGQSGSSKSPNDAASQQGASARRQDKAHDGEAIEQALKELQAKDGTPAEEPPGQQQPGGGQQQSAKGQKEGTADGQTQGQDQKGTGQPKDKSAGQDQKGQGQQAQQPMPGAEPASPPQAGGQSGAQGQQAESSGKPGPNDQKLEPMGQGAQGQGEKSKSQDRVPDEKQEQSSAEQQSGGNKGGVPKGPTKTDEQQQSSKSAGEKKDAGAGQQGEEGAGDASKEKSGSGEGTKANRDRKKDQKPDSSKAQEGEPSPPSESKKQSDSKGGQSGDQSGGGKQGAGQSAGQEGNDSAGSKSAADQGAGKAGETGQGETGSKAGSQQDAAGKTGKSGQERGEGSGTKADEHGTVPSAKGEPQKESPDQPQGEPSKDQQTHGDKGGKRGGSGQPLEGGGDGERPPADASPSPEVQAADAANLEYARKATEMALKRLKDEEHNPDPELLDKLGWSKEDLAEFLRRWDALQKSAHENANGKRELDEALRSLGLRDPANRKRAGGSANDTQRDLRDAGNRSSAPPKYRDLFDSFRKGAARSRQ